MSRAPTFFFYTVLPFPFSARFTSLFSPTRREHCTENFHTLRRVGPRHRLPYLCETATLLIFQRSRRVACCNEIISSALIFSPCGTPPGHCRQPPRRSLLKMRGCPRYPSRMSHSPDTLHSRPRAAGRQARHTVHLNPPHPRNEFLLYFLLCRNAFFLPYKKQFSNYDKCQPVILCAFSYSFHYVASRLIIIFSHDISCAAVLTKPYLKCKVNVIQRKKNSCAVWYCTAIVRYFAWKTAIDGDDDECLFVRGNAEDIRRWSSVNESPFSLVWYR